MIPNIEKNPISEIKYDNDWHRYFKNKWMFVCLSKCQAEVLAPAHVHILGIKPRMPTKARCCFLYTQIFFSNIELLFLFQKGSKICNTEDLTAGYYIYNRWLHSALLTALLLFASKRLHKLHAFYLSCDFIMLHQIFHPQSILPIF